MLNHDQHLLLFGNPKDPGFLAQYSLSSRKGSLRALLSQIDGCRRESGLQAAPDPPLPSLSSSASQLPHLTPVVSPTHPAGQASRAPPHLGSVSPASVQPPAGEMRNHEMVCSGLSSSLLPVRHAAEARHSRAASSHLSIIQVQPKTDRLQMSQTSARLTGLSQPHSSSSPVR